MSTDFKDIRAALKVVIDSAESVQATYAYERSTFSGYPAVIVVPTDNEADYGDSNTDRVVYVFKVKIYQIIQNESESEGAEAVLDGVVDELLTIFRPRPVAGMGTACDWVEPAPSVWQYEERGEAIYRVAELRLRCIKYVS